MKMTVVNHKGEHYIINARNISINSYAFGKAKTFKANIDAFDLYISAGNRIIFESGGKVLFDGFVFTENKGYTNFNILAYDRIRYLLYKDTYNFSGKTASQIITKILSDKGLYNHKIINTKYVLKNFICQNQTALDIITTALLDTYRNTGENYYLSDVNGEFVLKKSQNTNWTLSYDNNIISFNRNTTIDNGFYNYVKLIQTNKAGFVRSTEAFDAESIRKYGHLQYTKNVNRDEDRYILKRDANKILESGKNPALSLDVTAIGHLDAEIGNKIKIRLRNCEKFYEYEIIQLTHNFNDGLHLMDLSLKLI